MKVLQMVEAGLQLILVALTASCVTDRGGAGTASANPDEAVAVREVIQGFVAASRAKRFDLVLATLSERWRSQLTVPRLTADFEAEPLAEDRVGRVEAAGGAPLAIDGGVAELPLGPGRTLGLVREAEGWRIDRLE